MDPATIMVFVLSLGGLALLVWFEINSRRNEVRRKQGASALQPGVAHAGKQEPGQAEPGVDNTKAA